MCDACVARFVVCVLTTCIAASSVVLGNPPVVSQQTQAVGLDYQHLTDSPLSNQEFMAGGGAVGDFDRDGDQDLFMVGGSGGVDRLLINDGTGHFTEQGAAWGVARTHRGTGAAVGDYDNDGDLDLLVTSIGPVGSDAPGTSVLYRNNGDGTFTDATDLSGLGGGFNPYGLGDTFSASFGDYDLDGDLDLAIAGWLGGNKLFRNNGDGTFTDVTTTALDSDMTTVRGFAPRFVDMDGDRYPELLWVADFFTSRYFINNADGSFTDATASSMTGLDSNGMGNTFGDYNNDGVFDWYVTSRIGVNGVPGPGASGNMLYMGTAAPHVYSEESIPRGVNHGYWGWGAATLDIDHDGDEDIFATNGFSSSGMGMIPSRMWLNDGAANFVDIAQQCGMDDAGQGRGVVHGDFDGDGDQEIVLINTREKHAYYRNDLSGDDINAVTLDFDTSGVDDLAPNGFGTRVEFESASFSQLRYLDGGTNYLSQSELSVHAGLRSDDSVDITVYWANGQVDEYLNVAPGRYTITALTCGADINADGAVNFFDISRFLQLFTDRHPQGDVSGDGSYNFFDVSAYLQQFNAGCP